MTLDVKCVLNWTALLTAKIFVSSCHQELCTLNICKFGLATLHTNISISTLFYVIDKCHFSPSTHSFLSQRYIMKESSPYKNMLISTLIIWTFLFIFALLLSRYDATIVNWVVDIFLLNMNLQFSSKLNLWYNAKVWKWRLLPLALSTNLREVSQCPTWAFSLLKAFSGHCETWQRFVDSSSSHTAAVLAVCLEQRLVTMLHGSPAPAQRMC